MAIVTRSGEDVMKPEPTIEVQPRLSSLRLSGEETC